MNRKTALFRTAAAFACALVFAGAASAQQAAPVAGADGVIAYPPSFFAEFKPSTAFDIVGRLPGFTFDQGSDVRGFGGAAGNVLIDGQRPSSKSVRLRDLLQRVPISQVERVELIRGGAPGIDMQGQAVIANVVRKAGAATTGSGTVVGRFYNDNFVGTNGRLEAAVRNGDFSVEGSLSNKEELHPDSGEGPFWRRSATGVTQQSGPFRSDVRTHEIAANGAAEYTPGQDVLRLNAAGINTRTNRNERSNLTDAAGAFTTTNRNRRNETKYEVGGDFDHPFTDTLSGQLIGLANATTTATRAASTSRNAPQQSTENNEAGERIVRGVLVSTPFAGARFEGGAEAAFNFLDANSTLTTNGVPVVLPSANVRVEEQRAEAFVNGAMKLLPSLSVEGGAKYETSTISQTGGATQEKTLSFLKPRLVATWNPSRTTQVRYRIERTIGQLKFSDFAAASELDTGSANAGNPNLEPERAWTNEVTVEQRFWGKGALVVTVAHSDIQSVVDLIPIANTFDAPGNIGDGTRDSIRLSVSLPLDKLGIPGAELKWNGTWLKSEVIDPVTKVKRQASFDLPFSGDFVLTKALPSLNSSLGLEAALGYEETSYRINEVRVVTEDTLYKAYWDWAMRPDILWRFQIENVSGRVKARDRTIYSGARSLNNVSTIEHRETKLDPFLTVRVRKTF